MGAVCALNGLLGGVYADMGLTGAPVPPAPPDAYLHGAANIGAHKGQVAEGRRTLPKVRLLQARNGKHVANRSQTCFSAACLAYGSLLTR
jgi:hypothetical protein